MWIQRIAADSMMSGAATSIEASAATAIVGRRPRGRGSGRGNARFGTVPILAIAWYRNRTDGFRIRWSELGHDLGRRAGGRLAGRRGLGRFLARHERMTATTEDDD